jgi:hypothetical protein
MLGRLMPIFEGKAAIVPRPKRPKLIKPEEWPLMLRPVAEVIRLEKRYRGEPEHEIAVA